MSLDNENNNSTASAHEAPAQDRRKQQRTVTGVVTSDKRRKTRTVSVTRLVLHPRYKKYIRRRTKYSVHDEDESSHNGDFVRIAPTRPLSKTKRWRLVEVIESAEKQRQLTAQSSSNPVDVEEEGVAK